MQREKRFTIVVLVVAILVELVICFFHNIESFFLLWSIFHVFFLLILFGQIKIKNNKIESIVIPISILLVLKIVAFEFSLLLLLDYLLYVLIIFSFLPHLKIEKKIALNFQNLFFAAFILFMGGYSIVYYMNRSSEEKALQNSFRYNAEVIDFVGYNKQWDITYEYKIDEEIYKRGPVKVLGMKEDMLESGDTISIIVSKSDYKISRYKYEYSYSSFPSKFIISNFE